MAAWKGALGHGGSNSGLRVPNRHLEREQSPSPRPSRQRRRHPSRESRRRIDHLRPRRSWPPSPQALRSLHGRACSCRRNRYLCVIHLSPPRAPAEPPFGAGCMRLGRVRPRYRSKMSSRNAYGTSIWRRRRTVSQKKMIVTAAAPAIAAGNSMTRFSSSANPFLSSPWMMPNV